MTRYCKCHRCGSPILIRMDNWRVDDWQFLNDDGSETRHSCVKGSPEYRSRVDMDEPFYLGNQQGSKDSISQGGTIHVQP